MIKLKGPADVEGIRSAGRIIHQIFQLLSERIKPGVSTWDLDQFIEKYIVSHGGRPAFKGYRGFPAASCISVNEEVVHGIPSEKKVLKEGDIVGVDIGVEKDSYYADAAYTFAVGQVSEEDERLMQVTHYALMRAIEKAKTARRIGDISYVIQRTVEREGFSVVREFVGHGVGFEIHEPPMVPNYGRPGTGEKIKPGLVLAIEPMVNAGTWEVVIDPHDNWTVRTKDRKKSAHYEHTIAILEGEVQILT